MAETRPASQPVSSGEAHSNTIDNQRREAIKKLGKYVAYTAPVTLVLLGKKAEAKHHQSDSNGSGPRVPPPTSY